MDNMKRCKQCGEIKIETEFRRYYNKTKKGRSDSRYTYCKSCERINTRYKYLNKKSELSEADQNELDQINELYDLLVEEGLEPPKRSDQDSTVLPDVQAMLEERRKRRDAVKDVAPEANVTTPQELLDWLTKDLSEYEDWELQDIMDDLEEKYRPQISVDPTSGKPIHDETHRDILFKIEARFEDQD